MIEAISQRIKQAGIIAILRGDFSQADMLHIGDALLAGGVTALEVTLNSPAALTALPPLRKHFADSMLIGAGTARTVSDASAAVDAGAQFLVSPNLDLKTVAYAQSRGVLHLPGVFTATEAQTAITAGCKMLKLFPMDAVGPAHLKALSAPLDDVAFVPTGGISLENIGEYARAGAAAVGLGSKLVPGREMASAELTNRARALQQAWQSGRNA